MDEYIVVGIVVLIIVAVVFFCGKRTTNSFVASSDSVGCDGDKCYIRRPGVRPVQQYNNLNSWYLYGPQNPPFIGWLRRQIAVNDNDMVNSYAFDLNMQ